MILVTGGAGYVGSHVVKELCDTGAEVLVVDNLSTGHKKAIDLRAAFEVGDLLDTDFLKKIFSIYSIKGVLHFAASSTVGESMNNPSKYFRNNVVATLNLLNEMQQANVNKLVFSSTAAVYGQPNSKIITEEHSLNPTNVYGLTKVHVEQMIQAFCTAYGLRSAALRYFNAAGAHPKGSLGEDHCPETHLLPLIFKVLLKQRPCIKIFGNDYPTPDGTCIRDYIHVMDLASAHLKALSKLNSLSEGHYVYNLGYGRGYSVEEIIGTVEEITGLPVSKVYDQRRIGDPSILVASADKAKIELAWEPRYNLKDVIEHAWKWHSQYPKGFSN